MNRFLSSLLALCKQSPNRRRSLPRRQARFQLECLEDRSLPSASPLTAAASVTVSAPVITTGTTDTVTLTVKNEAGLQSSGGLLIPSYIYPVPGGAWDQMAAEAKTVNIMAILNPDSGPGASADPNYAATVNKLRAAGGKVIGYVATDYGSTPLSVVETEIKDYTTWYHLDGIFIDEMSTNPGSTYLTYYNKIYNYVHSLGTAMTVVGNPGTNTTQAYLTTPTADTLVLYEDGAGYTTYSPPAWQASYSASHFANIVYGVPTAAAMQTDVNLAATRNTGWVYVTNAGLPNPYGALPSYWQQEVSAEAADPSLTVHFGLGAGGSSGSFGPVTNHGGGVFTATFTGMTAGSANTITASINGLAVAGLLPTITVTPGAPARLLFVEPASGIVTNTSSFSVAVEMLDAYGNAVAQTDTLTVRSNNRVVETLTGHTNSAGIGVFEVALSPGSYTLEDSSGNLPPVFTSLVVR